MSKPSPMSEEFHDWLDRCPVADRDYDERAAAPFVAAALQARATGASHRCADPLPGAEFVCLLRCARREPKLEQATKAALAGLAPYRPVETTTMMMR